MSDGERAKRPPLERTEPIRSWSGLVRAPAAPGAAGEPGSEGIDDVIVRSVELGYRVIDEYVKRGQVAAQRMQHGAYGAGDMARDAQGVAGQMVRSAADLAGAWVEFFALTGREGNGHGPAAAATTTVPGAEPAMPAASAPSAASAVAGPAEPLRVRLQLLASRPVETALELRPVPVDHRLVAHALRGVGPARIDDVQVETRDGTAVVRIVVTAAHAPGSYTGLLFDDVTNLPVGEINVVLAAE